MSLETDHSPAATEPSQALTRRLVTVEEVVAVKPIADADAIEVVQVRGWEVVVKKSDGFMPGDKVVYFEIDSALPLTDPRFEFLAARSTKTFVDPDGATRPVHVLKTARLRGTYSQGLVLPLAGFPELTDTDPSVALEPLVGVVKWEPAMPAGSQAIGPFPSHLRTTDAERVQNIDEDTWATIQSDPAGWVATEKLDGTSMTLWADADGVVHMAGRNWELDPAPDTPYRRAMYASGAADLLQPGEAVQGEAVGPGVQRNGLDLAANRFVVFGFYRNYSAEPVAYDQWPQWALDLRAPVYDVALPVTVAEAIEQADGIKSLITPSRLAEGIVWTRRDGDRLMGLDGRHVWKAISNKWLSRAKD